MDLPPRAAAALRAIAHGRHALVPAATLTAAGHSAAALAELDAADLAVEWSPPGGRCWALTPMGLYATNREVQERVESVEAVDGVSGKTIRTREEIPYYGAKGIPLKPVKVARERRASDGREIIYNLPIPHRYLIDPHPGPLEAAAAAEEQAFRTRLAFDAEGREVEEVETILGAKIPLGKLRPQRSRKAKKGKGRAAG